MAAISHFARFSGGFTPPKETDGLESLSDTLLPAAQYFARHLDGARIACSAPDWGGYDYTMRAPVGRFTYELSVSFDYSRWQWFELSYLPALSWLQRTLGKSELAEMKTLSSALHASLLQLQGIREIRWYRKPLGDPDTDFHVSPELGGASTP